MRDLVGVLSVGWVKRADSAANSALLCSIFDRSLISCDWILKYCCNSNES